MVIRPTRPRRRLRRLTPTTILTPSEVSQVVAEVHARFGEWFAAAGHAPAVEDTVRLGSLRAQCKAKREERGLSIKEAAGLLRVPQYRVKAIEDGACREVLGPILQAYIEELGLDAWYERWRWANSDLARRLEAEGTASRKP